MNISVPYINGKFLQPKSRDSNHAKDIVSPFTGEVIRHSYWADEKDIEEALKSSQEAYDKWRFSTRNERQILLRSIARKIEENIQELSHIMALEVGKPISVGRMEVGRAIVTLNLAADLLSSYGTEYLPCDAEPRGHGYMLLTERHPIGPILGITPYNWPVNLVFHKIAPAIAAGNSIVIKCSPFSCLTSSTLAKLIDEINCPKGLVNIFCCSDELSEKIAKDSRIQLVSFTGSEKVGWHIKNVVPEKKVVLELGGRAPTIVCDDSDINMAAKITVPGSFSYAGQSCISVQHIYAHIKIYSKFKSEFEKLTKKCQYGNPLDEKVICGPVINEAATKRIEEWIEESVKGGAKILVGNKRKGNVIKPTIIENPPVGSKITSQEIFGPVVTLESFNNYEQLIQDLNKSKNGIHAGIFTNDLNKINYAFKTLEMGGIIWNDTPNFRIDMMPYGGVKRSGFGREGLRYAFDEMTELKALIIKG